MRLLRKRATTMTIKAVVLRIDSPGGSMFASEVIRREIDALREAGKPVIASMSSTAASGGYYIAMDADEIWASPATLTGSIGVFAVFPTFERTLEKIGVTIDGVGTTPLADALRLDRTLAAKTHAMSCSCRSSTRTAYSSATSPRRARSRSTRSMRWRRVASGRASMPPTNGLVDKLGSYREALDAAAAARRARQGLQGRIHRAAAGLAPGARAAVAGARRARSRARSCRSRSSCATARRLFAPLEAELARLARFTDPKQVYYYCACSVH